MRLGEYFIKKGIISKQQLEQALRAQLIFGGHLGTCLMEMGLVDEDLLGESLATIFGVRYAPPALFADVPRSVIETMTQRLVEKYHAVPFERTNRMLHLAMIDPKNLPALDEISFATACKIEPWVAPEARIFQVMERYYDIPRRQRYIAVCQNMDGDLSSQGKEAAQESRPSLTSSYAPPPYVEALGKASKDVELSAPPEEPAFEPPAAPRAAAPEPEQWEGGPPPAPPMPRPTPSAPPALTISPFAPPPPPVSPSPMMASTFRPATRPPVPEPPTTAPRSEAPPSAAPRDVAPQFGGPQVGGPQVAAPQAAAPPPPAPQPAAPETPRASGNFAQEGLSNRLCQAETAEDLSRCALEYALHGLERCALFLIRSTTASLWCSRGLGWDQERGRILNLSVTSDPLFELLLERDHYRGPVPEDVGIHASFKAIKIEVPSELLLVPGYVEDRMVVLLYGDGGVNGAIRGETADLCTLVRKLALALHVVMLKRKLRSLDLRPPNGQSMRAA